MNAGVIVTPCAFLVLAAGIKLVGIPQPKPKHRFSRICLPQKDLGLVRFWGYPAATVAMKTLLIFLGS